MAVLKKSDMKAPVLPKETVNVPSLDGDVIVQGLMLKDRLDIYSAEKTEISLSKFLAVCVVDADGKALFTQQEWEIFGGNNTKDAIELFKVAKRLNGLDAKVVEKNL
jgi:hypothetical protein